VKKYLKLLSGKAIETNRAVSWSRCL